MISALFYITGILIALACMVAFYTYYRRYQRIRKTDTTPIGNVAEGCFEIKGRIVALQATLHSPLSQTPCVFYDLAVVAGRRSRWFSKGQSMAQDKSHNSFGVQDETGTAIIDIKDAEYALNLDQKRRITKSKSSDPSSKAILDHYRISEKIGKQGEDEVVIYETFLEEGDELYVLGYVTRFQDSRPVFTSGECPILISDKSEKKLVRHTLLYASLYLILFFLMGFLMVIFYLMDQHP